MTSMVLPDRSQAMPAALQWTIVTLLVGSGVVSSLQIGKAVVAAPLLQADFNVSLTALGWLTGMFAVFGFLGGIPAGAFVSRVGDRRIFILGLAVIVLGSALGALAPAFAILLMARAIEGLGILLIAVAGPAILQRVVDPSRRDVAFGLWSCFMPIGMALAMLIGPFFVDWHMLWWGGAALAAVAAYAVFLIVPTRAASTAPAQSSSLRSLVANTWLTMRSRGPVLMAVCFALYSLMFLALFNFLPVLLNQRMQVAHGWAGPLSALATGANIIGNLAAGHLLARGVGRAKLIVFAAATMGIAGLGVFLPVFPDTVTFLLCVLFAAVGGLIPATLFSTVPILAPSAVLAPVVVGLMNSGVNFGQVIGPVLVSGAFEALGWPGAGAVVAVAALLAITVAIALGIALQAIAKRAST